MKQLVNGIVAAGLAAGIAFIAKEFIDMKEAVEDVQVALSDLAGKGDK